MLLREKSGVKLNLLLHYCARIIDSGVWNSSEFEPDWPGKGVNETSLANGNAVIPIPRLPSLLRNPDPSFTPIGRFRNSYPHSETDFIAHADYVRFIYSKITKTIDNIFISSHIIILLLQRLSQSKAALIRKNGIHSSHFLLHQYSSDS